MTQDEKIKESLETKIEEAVGWSYRDTTDEYGEPVKVLDETFLKENLTSLFGSELNSSMGEVVKDLKTKIDDLSIPFSNKNYDHVDGQIFAYEGCIKIIKSLLNDTKEDENAN